MRILVDADACPVKAEIEKIAKEFSIEVIMFIDTNHVLNSPYSEIVVVGAGKDAVDLALVNRAEKGDIVVSQDYGVAAMALSRGAFPLDQNGRVYNDDNINQLLFERHISAKVRRGGGRAGRFKKRETEQNAAFEAALKGIVEDKNN